MTSIARRGILLALGLAVMALGQENIRRVQTSLAAPFVYWKDCNQPYVMGKALLSGVDPYRPLPELGALYLPESRFADHPTPYPPFVSLVGLPMALLPYETAAAAWLAGEVLCLFGAFVILLRIGRVRLDPLSLLVAFGVVLVFRPVSDELRQGQFMSFLLLLFCGAWYCLKRNLDAAAGVLLGLFISIKLIVWPVVVLLMLRGRWRAVRSALLTTILLHLLTVPFVGLFGIIDYYTRVGPLNAAMWRPAEENYSIWGWANRLFTGFGFSFFVMPLKPAPGIAAWLTPILPGLCLVFGLALARRAKHLDTAIALAAGLILLLSPVFWHFYLIFVAVPIVVLARRLARAGWPQENAALALGLLTWLIPSTEVYKIVARAFGEPAGPITRIPFLPGLALLAPVFALLGLLWMTWRTDATANADED